MEPTATATGETSQPATLPIGSAPDLDTYRKAKSEGLTEIPNTKALPSTAPVDEAPDPEVEADPELRAAIDELEAPKDNETPAEKAARTRKHKESARKGFQTRQANKITRLARENEELRQRLMAPVGSGTRPEPAAHATRSAATTETATDPTDPEPTLESVTAKYPNDPDIYARFLREQSAWDRRQETRAHDTEQRTAHQRQAAQAAGKQLEAHADHGRGVHRDYDVKVAALGQLLEGHPADEAIGDALAGIDDAKVGGELLYQLASKLDDLKTAIRGGRASLLLFIGGLRRDITAAAEKPAPAAVSAAPAPHKPVAAASSASTSFDVTKPNGSVEDYRRHKQTAGARS